MHILFVTAEMASPGDNSTLATTSVSLPKVLSRGDTKVTVLSPLYKTVNIAALGLARRLTKIKVNVADKEWACELYTGRLPNGVHLAFIGNEEVILPATNMMEGNDTAVAIRAAVFSAAAAEFCKSTDSDFDIVHGFDWLGAAVIAALKNAELEIPTALTIDDENAIGEFSMPESLALGDIALVDDKLSLLQAGIRQSDKISFTSATAMVRLTETPPTHSLHHAVKEQYPNATVIENGIDTSTWNPITDEFIPARFDPVERSGKEKCKADLQRQLALPVRFEVPLIGAIGHVDDGGLQHLAKIGAELLKNDVQLVVQLRGNGELVGVFEDLWDEFPERLVVRTGSADAFSHQLFASADIFALPNNNPPIDNAHLIAMRYGALPVVYRRGHEAGQVVDLDSTLLSGCGFLFDERDAESLLATLRRSIAAFTNRDGFAAAQKRAMKLDHSWERTVRRYERLYTSVAA